MNYTKEVLYHFLITGVIAGVVLSLLVSQSQTNLTTVNFAVSIQASISDDILVLMYSIYNTGDTIINDVVIVARCCSYDTTSSTILNPNDHTSVTEYLSINGATHSKGDTILVEFWISDSMGNSKSMIQSTKLR